MKCDRCGRQIEKGDEMEYMGQILCEDCYMDILSPARACDPWAVYTAKSTGSDDSTLTGLQEDILDILKETGGIEQGALAERLGLELSDLEREIATLRHMEKIKATMKGNRKLLCLW